jgi:hypothetical protein
MPSNEATRPVSSIGTSSGISLTRDRVEVMPRIIALMLRIGA